MAAPRISALILLCCVAGSFQANIIQQEVGLINKTEAAEMKDLMDVVKMLPKPYQAIFGAVMELVKAEQALFGENEADAQAAEMKLIKDMGNVTQAALQTLATGKLNMGPSKAALKDIMAFGKQVIKNIMDEPKALQGPAMKVLQSIAGIFAPLKGINGKIQAYAKKTSGAVLKADMELGTQLMGLIPKLLTGNFDPQDLIVIYTNYAKAVEGVAAGAIKPLTGQQ